MAFSVNDFHRGDWVNLDTAHPLVRSSLVVDYGVGPHRVVGTLEVMAIIPGSHPLQVTIEYLKLGKSRRVSLPGDYLVKVEKPEEPPQAA